VATKSTLGSAFDTVRLEGSNAHPFLVGVTFTAPLKPSFLHFPSSSVSAVPKPSKLKATPFIPLSSTPVTVPDTAYFDVPPPPVQPTSNKSANPMITIPIVAFLPLTKIDPPSFVNNNFYFY
jgi:hypothetical protein